MLKQCKIPDYEAILEAQKSQQVKDELAKNINDAVQSEVGAKKKNYIMILPITKIQIFREF